ncbi:large ribosomal subunit protein mL64 [Neocloeon triangulifer]|uniref:large ribosomal subunit protein mL64 n=1 Tax=Neocloeon triangulifer TaxID=2078957 RepID=UPI00286F3395|nr:large ribosomal subunit protein mL64 [Neocloeon triangulifer]
MAASVSRACVNLCRKSVKLGTFNLNADCRIVRNVSVNNFDCIRRFSSKNEAKEELAEFDFDEDDEAAEEERRLEKRRNKSGLRKQHFRVMHGMQPYEEPVAWFHHSIKYKKRMFGRYGIDGTDIPLGALWPDKEDLADKKEYEACVRPMLLQEVMKKVQDEKIQAEEEQKKRQADMAVKFEKIGQWRKEMDAKIEKKRKEAQAIKDKRDRLVEEVRRLVGYNVDPRDEKFKVLLEQKEKEQKKKEKEEKKAQKAAKMMEIMMAKAKVSESGQ